jgi:APA family basic amino acid/polyamine antiporter
MMGLGSIIGTGVFVSIGIAAGITGPSVLLAIVLAAGVATCNALNSAQLAANLPVSGGTYEYGYHYLRPWLGFLAGWMFLCAKLASAATAALGCSGYLLVMVGQNDRLLHVSLAVLLVLVVTAIVVSGMRLSSRINMLIVSMTLLSLLLFVAAGLPLALEMGRKHLVSWRPERWSSFFEATALMFVAYTGYGRIATLGEEVLSPRKTIPAAIILTLIVSAVLYAAVAAVGVASVGTEAMFATPAQRSAPLEVIAHSFPTPQVALVIALGAVTAMLGVLLNLLLGLSRVLLAMGRRGDMPAAFAKLNQSQSTPYAAVLTIGASISLLALLGNVKTTWSFSAFTVLIYYAVTNLAALALPPEQRLYPRWLAYVGLAACLFLAFWVQWQVWLAGLGIVVVGMVWHLLFRVVRYRASKNGMT